MKTSELTGVALDWAVAKCEGYDALDWFWDDYAAKEFMPSTDWSEGGPIIEREGVSLNHLTITEDHQRWAAHAKATIKDVKPRANYGPTPLLAAMRCYVASKLGDKVDIPEDLS